MDFSVALAEVSRLQPAANAVVGTLPVFALSGLAAMWCATSVLVLEHSEDRAVRGYRDRYGNLIRALKVLIAAPLLLGVPLTSGLIVKSLQHGSLVELKWLQNTGSLAGFGFLIFTILAYALLANVFDVRERYLRASRMIQNMSSEPWLRRAAVVAHCMMPAMTMTLAILIVLQNSMYAAPKYVSQPNAMTFLTETLSHLDAPIEYRGAVAVVLVGVVGSFLLLSYFVPLLLGRFGLWCLSRYRRGSRRAPNILRVAQDALSATCIPTVLAMVCFFSMVVLVAIVFVTRLATGVATNSIAVQVEPALESLAKPGPCAALAVGVTIWLLAILRRSRSLRVFDRRGLFGLSATVAFIPPTLYGSLLLPFMTGASRPFLVWGSTILWSAGILVFLSYGIIFERRYSALVNLRFSGRRRWGAFWRAVGVSRLGSLAPLVVITVYLLWVEEGLQLTLNVDGTFATLLYRGHSGEWSMSLILGVIVCLLGCFLVLSASIMLQPMIWRLADGNFVGGKRARTVAMLLLCAPVFSGAASAVEMGDMVIPAGVSTFEVGLPNEATELQYGEWRIENESLVYVDIPPGLKSLEIDRLSIGTTRPPQIRFRGSGLQMQFFEIGRVSFSQPTGRPLRLTFDNFRAVEFRIGGSAREEGWSLGDRRWTELEFDSRSGVANALLRSLTLGRAQLGVATDANDPEAIGRIELIGIRASGVSVSGRESIKPQIQISADARMWRDPDRSLPSLNLQGVVWRGGSIRLDPEGGAEKVIVDMADIDFNAGREGAGHLNVAAFPAAEIRWSESEINGSVAVVGARVEELVLHHLKTGNQDFESNLLVAATTFSAVGLLQIDLDNLTIDSSREGGDSWHFRTLRAVHVQDRMAVPKSFLMSAVSHEGNPSSLDARSFMTTLQNVGVYTDNETPVGYDAVYHRNLEALKLLWLPAGVLVDWSTGFGVKLKKPVITWCAYTLAYLVVGSIVLRMRGTHDGGVLGGAKRIIAALVGWRWSDEDDADRFLAAASTLYRFVFIVQVTAVTVYLGETVLSLT
jgi:hypothetical protein